MNRYHEVMTEAEVREALREWLQDNRYPNRTIGKVVYFSHDLMTGSVTVETSYPLPSDDDEEDFDDSSEDYSLDHEDEDE